MIEMDLESSAISYYSIYVTIVTIQYRKCRVTGSDDGVVRYGSMVWNEVSVRHGDLPVSYEMEYFKYGM